MSFITIKTIPRITFAQTYEPYSKRNTLLPVIDNCIEISYLKKGLLKTTIDGKDFTFYPNDVLCHTHKSPVDVEFIGKCEIHTVIFYFDCVYSEKKTDGAFYLPHYFSDSDCAEILCKLIDEVIVTYNTLSRSSPYIISLIFSIIALIDKHNSKGYNRLKSDYPPVYVVYVDKIKKYIFDNINRHISLDELATYLDLSAPYICNVFKKVTNQSITHYTNTLKLYKIKELLYSHSLTLYEAGEQVGITDVHYISRMFKKYFNINISDIRKIRYEEKI